ncbi:MAG: DHH family phosphoesterase [Oscillatoriaceae cyanobacterium]
MQPTYILYHGHCYDGFGAAWAAWKALGDNAQYIGVNYGEPQPEIPDNAAVFIVDFSYPRDVLLELKERSSSLLVLDHHKTAQEDLRELDFAVFDMQKSGAMLAWEFWHPGEPIPELISYIQDRDLWRFELPQSREVFVALTSYPMEFQVWDSLDVGFLKTEGAPILRFQQQTVKNICRNAFYRDVGGYNIPVVNATAFFSDVAHELCCRYPEAAFTAYYYDRKDGKRQWGLRSEGDFDVSAVAKKLGGGGHRNAAGFVEG